MSFLKSRNDKLRADALAREEAIAASKRPAIVEKPVVADDFDESDFMNALFDAERQANANGFSIIDLIEELAQTHKRTSLKVPTTEEPKV